MDFKVCPKCQYQRHKHDGLAIEGVCPACGIAYEKWMLAQQQIQEAELQDQNSQSDEQEDQTAENDFEYEYEQSLLSQIKGELLYVPERVDSVTFWARALLFVVFFLWGWSFIIAGINVEKILGSFLHSIILPFHEFGHVLFSPFGRFMTILGGSLFQVLMPLGLAIAFIYYNQDNFAASIMLWWCGQSFIDLSLYIADAMFRTLPLISGMGEESHDWGNLLSMMGWLEHDWTIARISFGIGVTLILVSWAWGGYILYLQKTVLDDGEK